MHLIHVVPPHSRATPPHQFDGLQSAGHTVQQWRRTPYALAGLVRDAGILVDARARADVAAHFCHTLRRIRLHVPVLALLEPGQLVEFTDWPVDDFLLTTSTPAEWIHRVRWSLEQFDRAVDAVLAPADNVELDGSSFTLTVAGEVVALTQTEHRVLDLFFRNPEIVLSRNVLLAQVWDGASYSSRHIDTFVCRLRQKMGTAGDALETVRGVGYRFAPLNLATSRRAA